MDWNDGEAVIRIRELERRIRDLEEQMRRQIERLEEELKARGWK